MHTISVILPVFNGGKFLRAAVESILQQSYQDLELILIDDGSTDDTHEILNSLLDERILRINHPTNLGLIDSLNEGISLAKGKYLARMDADDVALPERFVRQVAFLESNPEVGVLGTQVQFLDEKLEKPLWEYHYPTRHAEIAWKMMFMNIVPHPSVMVRRELLVDNIYNSDYATAEDYELWTRLITKTEFANLDDVLLLYRRHPETVSELNKQIQLEKTLRIRHNYIASTTGLDLRQEQMLMLFQCPPFEQGLAHDVFKQFVDLLFKIFRAYQRKHSIELDDLEFILDDLGQHIQSVYVKPYIVTEQVVVMREPTKEELRLLMIANMPHSWQRMYGFLRKLHLIQNPLQKD